MARADKLTIARKKQVIYRDFLNNFNRNPFTGTLGVLENEDAISQSLKNLFLTGEGERFMDASKGGNFRHLLFQNIDRGMFDAIRLEAQTFISQYEPRVEVVDIRTDLDHTVDQNALNVTIVYKVVNATEIRELNLVVRRTR